MRVNKYELTDREVKRMNHKIKMAQQRPDTVKVCDIFLEWGILYYQPRVVPGI